MIWVLFFSNTIKVLNLTVPLTLILMIIAGIIVALLLIFLLLSYFKLGKNRKLINQDFKTIKSELKFNKIVEDTDLEIMKSIKKFQNKKHPKSLKQNEEKTKI